jgi:uncharacterized protein YndB with AHSA1/START domain
VDARTKDSGAFALAMPSDREIVFTRVFNAPRRLVFESWTKPEHVMRWYGCGSSSMTACEIDLRPGGVYRFVTRLSGGTEYTLSGVYRDIVPPARIVCTERFNDDPTKEALIAVTFEEHDGKTTMTSTALYRTEEDRNAVLEFGVEKGAAETFDRLAEYLETIV